MITTASRRWTWGATCLLALLLVGVPGFAEQLPASLEGMSPEERKALEERVGEMERALAQARDNALAKCRARLSKCNTKTCGRLPESQGAAWQKCQTNCEDQYETCQQRAREIWPDE